MAGVRMRPAVEADIPAIAALERRPENRCLVSAWTEAQHRHALAGPDARYLVAESGDGQFSGYAVLLGVVSPHRSIELKRIVVSQPGSGVGGAMLRAILALAFGALQAHRVWLDVFATNTRARRIYERLGFQREGVLREAALVDDSYHDLILMSLLDREYAAQHGAHTARD
jgi:diamine N-acetyltransferase